LLILLLSLRRTNLSQATSSARPDASHLAGDRIEGAFGVFGLEQALEAIPPG